MTLLKVHRIVHRVKEKYEKGAVDVEDFGEYGRDDGSESVGG